MADTDRLPCGCPAQPWATVAAVGEVAALRRQRDELLALAEREGIKPVEAMRRLIAAGATALASTPTPGDDAPSPAATIARIHELLGDALDGTNVETHLAAEREEP